MDSLSQEKCEMRNSQFAIQGPSLIFSIAHLAGLGDIWVETNSRLPRLQTWLHDIIVERMRDATVPNRKVSRHYVCAVKVQLRYVCEMRRSVR